MGACMHTCTCACVCECVDVDACKCRCVCARARVCVSVCTYMRMYLCRGMRLNIDQGAIVAPALDVRVLQANVCAIHQGLVF